MKDEAYSFHQTPPDLAKKLIDYIPLQEGDRVLEPFKGDGAFYDNLPDITENRWCEIEEGRDYKDFTDEVDWVITNPPFRIDDGTKQVNAFFTLLTHFTKIAQKGIAFLSNDVCFSTLTPKRMKEIQETGFFIHKVVVCSVKKWRGRYFFVVFKKEPNDMFEYIQGSY